MAVNHAEFYDKFGLKMIGAYLQTVAGKPKKIVVDEKLYRQQVIDPCWESLPQPMRLMGRNRLRWDEVLLALRTDIFIAVQDKLALRKDAAQRMRAVVEKLMGKATRKSAVVKPAEEDIPFAFPASKQSKSAFTPNTIVVGIDLGTT